MSAVDAWWTEVTTAALVGTARRPVPPTPSGLPYRDPATVAAEEALLDAAAVGSALRRSGRVATPTEAPTPAPDDALPAAPRRARQLLDLALTQSPVGARLRPQLLRVWLRAAAEHGVRAHHGALIGLLEAGTKDAALRADVRPVLDRRGTWLAASTEAWSWAAEVAPTTAGPSVTVDADAWAQLPSERRAAVLLDLRRTDRGAARALLDSTWRSDPAGARVELLGALRADLGPDDDELLERVLDDRSARVREQAWSLLEALPGSERGGRMGARLRPLLSVRSHLLRRGIHVELPDEPDADGVRDGLVPAPAGRSQRGWWLERIVAGAPLDVWTSTGLSPDAVVRTLDEPDAEAGLRRAVLARGDVVWARALLERGDDDALVRLLPAAERAARVPARLATATTVPAVLSAVAQLPAPWPADVSAVVVARLRALARTPFATTSVALALAEGLDPGVAPQVQSLATALGGDDGPDTALHQLAQLLSLVPTITEAFR